MFSFLQENMSGYLAGDERERGDSQGGAESDWSDETETTMHGEVCADLCPLVHYPSGSNAKA